MIAFFAVVGVLAFTAVIIALVLYVMDLPAQDERLRIEREVRDTAFRISEHARKAFGQMLDAARSDPEDPA